MGQVEKKIRTLILAPHVDDEAIGCWSVIKQSIEGLRDTQVVYFNEISSERRAEAINAGLAGSFIPVFIDNLTYPVSFPDSQGMEDWTRSQFDEVYVPARTDWHAAHKKLNADYRKYATHFYMTDMVEGAAFIGETQSQEKRDFLDAHYVSQRHLWKRNAKYYLFESLSDRDYQVTKIMRVKLLPFFTEIVIEYPEQCQQEVQASLDKAPTHPEDLFDDLLARIVDGKVRVVTPTAIYEV